MGYLEIKRSNIEWVTYGRRRRVLKEKRRQQVMGYSVLLVG